MADENRKDDCQGVWTAACIKGEGAKARRREGKRGEAVSCLRALKKVRIYTQPHYQIMSTGPV